MDLPVRVQPKSRRPAIGGRAPDGLALRVAVAEAPEDGRANRAVCEAVARALGLPPSAVQVIRGATSRSKLLRLAGDPAILDPRIKELLA
jgi:hypothetical protein